MPEVTKHVLESHTDRRGWVVNPLVEPFPDIPLGQAHIASLEPGAVRGNHYHPGSAEYVFVWGGNGEVVWQDGSGRTVTEEAVPTTPTVFEIPAGIVHAVVNTGDRTLYLIAYYLGVSENSWPETERSVLVP